MISYSDFEFAIARWKSRAAGVPQPAAPVPSGTVAAEVPVATAPEDPAEAVGQESGIVTGRAATPVSGNVLLSDALMEPPGPESESEPE
jgi:hypothetical protein